MNILKSVVTVVLAIGMTGCVSRHFSNIKPVTPYDRFGNLGSPFFLGTANKSRLSDSLTPTFVWKDKGAPPDTTYDLGIWEKFVTKQKSGLSIFAIDVPVRGKRMYLKEGIAGNEHKPEIALEPATEYYWSVKRTGSEDWATATDEVYYKGTYTTSEFFSFWTPRK